MPTALDIYSPPKPKAAPTGIPGLDDEEPMSDVPSVAAYQKEQLANRAAQQAFAIQRQQAQQSAAQAQQNAAQEKRQQANYQREEDARGNQQPIPAGLAPSGASRGPDGKVAIQYSAPTAAPTTGTITERDMAEKGIDVTGIPREKWQSLLANKLDPVRAKLDVQQKAALGGAAQAIPVMTSAMAEYDAIAGSAGPVSGRVSAAREAMGFGSKEFATANAKLQGNLFNVARSLQGAGVLTEMDIKRMEQIAPSLKMNRDQFEGKVNAVKQLMRERLIAWRELNDSALDESQRVLVEGLIKQTEPAQPGAGTPQQPTQPPAQPNAAPAPAATPQQPSVRMKTPGGQIILVPAQNVPAAQARGATPL